MQSDVGARLPIMVGFMAKIKLIELYECVQSALIALGISRQMVSNYRGSGFRPLQQFFEQKGCIYYSRKLADEFVADTMNARKNNLIPEWKLYRIRKVVAMLGEYKNTGTIKWRHQPRLNAPSLACKNFENTLSAYLLDMSNKERYSLGAVKNHRNIVKQFLLYLEGLGYRSLRCLTQKIISDYIPVIAKRRPGGISDVISILKSFLRYLYENKYINSDLVSALHGCPSRRKKHFIGFTREEAKKLIDSVTSDTHCGKRDLAILTLAENTGLRAIDVANLKLSDIDWRNKTISITQYKTRRPLILPFENRVGDTLAEYILHSRPESDSPFIFLSARRPFRPISTSTPSNVVSKYIKLSGIENKLSLCKGLHSFRRGIGTWLLEAELPLTMISEILGHGHIDSAKPYLSTDHKRLRECTIGLEGIEVRRGLFQ